MKASDVLQVSLMEREKCSRKADAANAQHILTKSLAYVLYWLLPAKTQQAAWPLHSTDEVII